jgi:hypothetical protein
MQEERAFGEEQMGQDDFDAGQVGALFFGASQALAASCIQLLAAQSVADHFGPRKETCAVGMVGVVVGVNQITHPRPQPVFQKILICASGRKAGEINTAPSG